MLIKPSEWKSCLGRFGLPQMSEVFPSLAKQIFSLLNKQCEFKCFFFFFPLYPFLFSNFPSSNTCFLQSCWFRHECSLLIYSSFFFLFLNHIMWQLANWGASSFGYFCDPHTFQDPWCPYSNNVDCLSVLLHSLYGILTRKGKKRKEKEVIYSVFEMSCNSIVLREWLTSAVPIKHSLCHE